MVSDIGQCMTQNQVEELFCNTSSRQNGVSLSQSPDSGELGMGLSTAKNLANALGGEILL
jgi:hypothetical protein